MQRHKTSERGIGHTKTRPPSTKKGQASILLSTGTKPSNKQNTTGYASKKDIRLKTRRNPPLTGNTRYKETHHTGIPARPGTRTQGEMATYAETKKPPGQTLSERLYFKGGGYLLSRIALQYHRRKWA